MPATYEPIATTTLGATTGTITISSIPNTYTDLRVVMVMPVNATDGRNPAIYFNGDTGTNYSVTILEGGGAAVASARAASQARIPTWSNYEPGNAVRPTMYIYDIQSYAGSTFKTVLVNANADGNGSGAIARTVGMWRSTSAINSVSLICFAGNSQFAIGTTVTVYGIKAA